MSIIAQPAMPDTPTRQSRTDEWKQVEAIETLRELIRDFGYVRVMQWALNILKEQVS